MKKRGLFAVLCFAFLQLPAQSLWWAKGMGGSLMDRAYSVAIDYRGSVYTTGHFSGTADFDPGPGVFNLTATAGLDIFISKLDLNGNFVWAKAIGGAYASISIPSDEGCSIAVDDSGSVYATGSFSGTADFDPGPGTFMLSASSVHARDLFILKLDPNGNFLWARGIGGKGSDVGESLTLDRSGGIYLTGFFQDTVDFDPGPSQYTIGTGYAETPFLLKLDAAGAFKWARALLAPVLGPYSSGEGRSIAWDKTGALSLTGWYKGVLDFDPGIATYTMASTLQPPAFPSADIFIMKVDTAGSFLWAKSIGSDSFYPDYGKSLAADSLGNVYVTGFFSDTCDFDPGPGTFTLGAVNMMAHGFVLKLNAQGNFVWARNTSASVSPTLSGSSVGCDITTDALGNVFVSGTFIGTQDFDPGPASYTLASRNAGNGSSANTFLSKLDASGNFIWAWDIASTVGYDANDRNSIVMDVIGNIYIAGHFSDTCDFDPGTSTFTMSANGGYDIFVTKLGQTPSPIGIMEAAKQASPVRIYPNPASERLIIEAPQAETAYRISDVTGRLVMSGKLSGATVVNIAHLAPGLYVVQLEGAGLPVKVLKE